MIKRQSLFEWCGRVSRLALVCGLGFCFVGTSAPALAENTRISGLFERTREATLLSALESRNLTHRDSRCSVLVSYPYVGNAKVDAELDYWANLSLKTFVSGVENFRNTGNLRSSMLIDYETTEPSPGFLSVVFRLAINTSGLLPDPGMVTFTYDLSDGRKLSLQDIFGDADGALQFFSSYSREVLLERLGDDVERSVRLGTAPDMLNFSMFALTPDGLVLFFPPDQVAPKNLGEQQVSISLDKLKPYGPRQEIWKKRKTTSFSVKG